MAEGIIFRDSADNRLTVEFSDEIPPTAPVGWNELPEVNSVTPNRTAAPDIPLTHFKSPHQEFATGLPDFGSYDISCNLVPTETNVPVAEEQVAFAALALSGQKTWVRITFPMAVATSTSQAIELFAGSVRIGAPTPTDTESAFSMDYQVRVLSDYTLTPETRL